jgi:hypothetical protein
MLRKGLAGGIESGESSFQEAIQPTSGQLANSDTRSRGGHELGQSFALLPRRSEPRIWVAKPSEI